jgi:hypothetical protein
MSAKDTRPDCSDPDLMHDPIPTSDNDAAAVGGSADKPVGYANLGDAVSDTHLVTIKELANRTPEEYFGHHRYYPVYLAPPPDPRMAELQRANAELIEQNTAIEKDQFEMGAKLAELMPILQRLVKAREKACSGEWSLRKNCEVYSQGEDHEVEIATFDVEQDGAFTAIAAKAATEIARIIAAPQDGAKEER